MPPPDLEIRPTIDRDWLEARVRDEPFLHAYALWDLERAPDQVRFVSAVRHGDTVGYLLLWLGRPDYVVVHWYGTGDFEAALADHLPPRPYVAVLPPDVLSRLEARLGSPPRYPLLLMERPGGGPVPGTEGVRRLTGRDRTALVEWSQRFTNSEVRDYPHMDPQTDAVWGAFSERGKLVGACRATVRLPRAWLLGGVFVEPEARSHGVGERMVAAAIREAEAARVRLGLFVREDHPVPVRLYARLGFRPVTRRLLVDAGGGVEP